MVTYTPFQEFSTTQLGIAKHSKSTGFPQNTYRIDTNQTEASLDTFNQAWDSDQLRDVTDSVISGIEQMYQENAPELIYYMAYIEFSMNSSRMWMKTNWPRTEPTLNKAKSGRNYMTSRRMPPYPSLISSRPSTDVF